MKILLYWSIGSLKDDNNGGFLLGSFGREKKEKKRERERKEKSEGGERNSRPLRGGGAHIPFAFSLIGLTWCNRCDIKCACVVLLSVSHPHLNAYTH